MPVPHLGGTGEGDNRDERVSLFITRWVGDRRLTLEQAWAIWTHREPRVSHEADRPEDDTDSRFIFGALDALKDVLKMKTWWWKTGHYRGEPRTSCSCPTYYIPTGTFSALRVPE